MRKLVLIAAHAGKLRPATNGDARLRGSHTQTLPGDIVALKAAPEESRDGGGRRGFALRRAAPSTSLVRPATHLGRHRHVPLSISVVEADTPSFAVHRICGDARRLTVRPWRWPFSTRARTVVAPRLPRWTESPPYVAVIVCNPVPTALGV